MKSIIQMLYDGEIIPTEYLSSLDKKHLKEWEETVQLEDAFIEKLDPEMRDEFHDILSKHFRLDSSDGEASFVLGFKMGARVMIEVFSDKTFTKCEDKS